MNLLKIGMLNMHQNRWEDALSLFDHIYVFTFNGIEDELENSRITYIRFNNKNIINKILFRIFNKTKRYINLDWMSHLIIIVLRNFNLSVLKKLSKLKFDYVHCSYSDFDDSGQLLLISKNVINKKHITRAYKETRPGYNFDEKFSFKIADRIVFNELDNRIFFESKYGVDLFEDKEIVTGLDEDYRKSDVIRNVKHSDKLSRKDGKIHLLILAGRVFSDAMDLRSGSRLYYISMIREFIEKGFVVHLDTLRIFPDSKGINRYEELASEYPENFIIEKPTNFKDNVFEAYYSLSRYDYGVLHNFIDGTSVTVFDKVNIPNRFYEYQIAQVIPILKKNTTVVMERILKERKCGVIYKNLEDLYEKHQILFYTPSFKEYIEKLYSDYNVSVKLSPHSNHYLTMR